jgi:DNA polymerase-3 subunit gamma/tau
VQSSKAEPPVSGGQLKSTPRLKTPEVKPVASTTNDATKEHAQPQPESIPLHAGSREGVKVEQAALLKVWDSLLQKAMDEGLSSILINMLKRKPVLQDDGTVALKMINPTLEQEVFQQNRDFVGNYLKEALQLKSIALTTVQTAPEQEAPVRRLYTNSDKFNYLSDKNPALKDFRNLLGLDIDF